MRQKSVPALLTLLALMCLPVSSSIADELDPASEEALLKTQQLLNSPELRDKAIAENKNAQLVDDQVRSLVGGDADREQIYSVSNQIFTDLVRSSGGDVKAMVEKLKKAKDDPKSFYESLSEKDRKAIQDIAKKISDKRTETRSPASSLK